MAKHRKWLADALKRAKDDRSIMRMHALSLLVFADGIEDDIAEAMKKEGARLTYTIQVTGPEQAPKDT